jgi:hypothetical protein
MQPFELWPFVPPTLFALAGFARGVTLGNRDAASVIDCSQFGAPGQYPAMQCVEYPGYPISISGANVDFYRYVDGWTTPDPEGDDNIAAIGSAVTTVLPLYTTLGSPFDIDLILVTQLLSSSDSGETIALPPDFTPCYVRILQITDGSADTSFDLQFATAHELYHCVQYSNQDIDLSADADIGWWSDGSADYFANTFYQDNTPLSSMLSYNPNIPLYSQSYPASLFFQFLNNQNWDAYDINSLVVQIIQGTEAGGAQRTIMSNNADLQNLFPIFAQAYNQLAITFPDGSLAQGNPDTQIALLNGVGLDLTSDGEQFTASLEVASFSMVIYTATLEPGITYSIQWTPAVQDGTIVLAYQQSDPSYGQADWITFDPSTPIEIPVGCSGEVQYQFLLTSTADADTATGQLVFTQESSQNCGCGDVGIPLDPCLSGNWNLDIGEFQAFLETRLAQLGSVTVSNLAVSGGSTFELPGGDLGAMTFDALIIDYDATADGMSFHTTIDLIGSVTGQVVMQTSGASFCWADGQGQGDADTSTTVQGLSAPIVFDQSLADGYVDPTITVQYTCSATSLQLQGYQEGQYIWALSYVKA